MSKTVRIRNLAIIAITALLLFSLAACESSDTFFGGIFGSDESSTELSLTSAADESTTDESLTAEQSLTQSEESVTSQTETTETAATTAPAEPTAPASTEARLDESAHAKQTAPQTTAGNLSSADEQLVSEISQVLGICDTVIDEFIAFNNCAKDKDAVGALDAMESAATKANNMLSAAKNSKYLKDKLNQGYYDKLQDEANDTLALVEKLRGGLNESKNQYGDRIIHQLQTQSFKSFERALENFGKSVEKASD